MPPAPQGRQRPRYPQLRALVGTGDFEGYVSFTLGLKSKSSASRAFTCETPTGRSSTNASRRPSHASHPTVTVSVGWPGAWWMSAAERLDGWLQRFAGRHGPTDRQAGPDLVPATASDGVARSARSPSRPWSSTARRRTAVFRTMPVGSAAWACCSYDSAATQPGVRRPALDVVEGRVAPGARPQRCRWAVAAALRAPPRGPGADRLAPGRRCGRILLPVVAPRCGGRGRRSGGRRARSRRSPVGCAAATGTHGCSRGPTRACASSPRRRPCSARSASGWSTRSLTQQGTIETTVTLTDHLPAQPDPDALFDAFAAWTQAQGLTLTPRSRRL